MLLNLFDVMDHFSPRLCFGAHFVKNLFQNNPLFQEESCYKTKESKDNSTFLVFVIHNFFQKSLSFMAERFAAYLKNLRRPSVEKRCTKASAVMLELSLIQTLNNSHFFSELY